MLSSQEEIQNLSTSILCKCMLEWTHTCIHMHTPWQKELKVVSGITHEIFLSRYKCQNICSSYWIGWINIFNRWSMNTDFQVTTRTTLLSQNWKIFDRGTTKCKNPHTCTGFTIKQKKPSGNISLNTYIIYVFKILLKQVPTQPSFILKTSPKTKGEMLHGAYYQHYKYLFHHSTSEKSSPL